MKTKVRSRCCPFLVLALSGTGVAFLGGCERTESPPGSVLSAASLDSHDGHPTIWFEEVAEKIGVRFTYVRGEAIRHWFPEIMGGGVGMFDYDNDGDLDLYFVQGGDLNPETNAARHTDRLFENRGDGTFVDVTEKAGIAEFRYGMGVACGDYDGDGWTDIYVTNVGTNTLYRNNGDGTFRDVTAEAAVGHEGWSTSAAFLDYDDDGHLDLFVTNYILWSPQTEIECRDADGQRDYCQPNNYNAPSPDVLFRNRGDGTFEDVTQASGVWRAFGNGLGVTIGDFNLDGKLDVYVANDQTPNQLWINQGDGAFEDEALLAGCALNASGVAEAGMGVAAADVNADGRLDLFVTHFMSESNTLYRNEGGIFSDVTAQAGLTAPSIPYTSFGVGFADFDHDGRLDLYVVNGRVVHFRPTLREDDPYAEPNQLFRGGGDGRFVAVQSIDGTTRPLIESSRGAAFGDLDNDGDVDIVVVNSGQPARVLRNFAGRSENRISFCLQNSRNGDAIGAIVEITANGVKQTRPVSIAASYCSSNDPRIHFGLGATADVSGVLVRWADGSREAFDFLPAGRLHVVRQGTGRKE